MRASDAVQNAFRLKSFDVCYFESVGIRRGLIRAGAGGINL